MSTIEKGFLTWLKPKKLLRMYASCIVFQKRMLLITIITKNASKPLFSTLVTICSEGEKVFRSIRLLLCFSSLSFQSWPPSASSFSIANVSRYILTDSMLLKYSAVLVSTGTGTHGTTSIMLLPLLWRLLRKYSIAK